MARINLSKAYRQAYDVGGNVKTVKVPEGLPYAQWDELR